MLDDVSGNWQLFFLFSLKTATVNKDYVALRRDRRFLCPAKERSLFSLWV
jgi:hypothetical protein